MFIDRVNHSELMNWLARKTINKRTLKPKKEYISIEITKGGVESAISAGFQGFAISPYLQTTF
jgi:hypothetical protein